MILFIIICLILLALKFLRGVCFHSDIQTETRSNCHTVGPSTDSHDFTQENYRKTNVDVTSRNEQSLDARSINSTEQNIDARSCLHNIDNRSCEHNIDARSDNTSNSDVQENNGAKTIQYGQIIYNITYQLPWFIYPAPAFGADNGWDSSSGYSSFSGPSQNNEDPAEIIDDETQFQNQPTRRAEEAQSFLPFPSTDEPSPVSPFRQHTPVQSPSHSRIPSLPGVMPLRTTSSPGDSTTASRTPSPPGDSRTPPPQGDATAVTSTTSGAMAEDQYSQDEYYEMYGYEDGEEIVFDRNEIFYSSDEDLCG